MCVKNLNRISVVFFWYWFMHIILEIRVTRLIFNKSEKYKSLFKSYFYVKENVLRVSTWYNCTLYISCKLLIPPEICRRKRACPLMWLYFFYLFKQFILPMQTEIFQVVLGDPFCLWARYSYRAECVIRIFHGSITGFLQRLVILKKNRGRNLPLTYKKLSKKIFFST